MSEDLWAPGAFTRAVEGQPAGSAPAGITGISIDTRTIRPGEAFFAIKGERLDGHDFVAAAFEGGAGLAVVAEDRRAEFDPRRGPLVVVPDVLDALRKLGRAARARTDARIIGVTGSVGKTGSKEALRLALSPSGATHASVASYNNHWGVPLTLARMPQETRFGVFEMGMNGPGEISALTRMVRPHIAIVTTVEPVHLEFFGSVEAIADAKAEIFEGVEPGGVALLNLDNPQFGRLSARAKELGVQVLAFGETDGADVRLIRADLHPDFSSITADVLGEQVTYRVGAPGRHLVNNSLAVLGAVQLAGADLRKGALALGEMRAPRGRGARFELEMPGGSLTVIDESYNANPASMRAALDLLGRAEPGPRGRRIAVLGDMLELGPASDELHRQLAAPVAEASADLVFASGRHMRALWDALAAERRGHYAEASEDLAEPLLKELRAGDVVMIKGSLGSRMGPIVEALRERFSSAEAGTA